jgi:predicted DsbA family dithiol-disulfide isomerase
MSPDHDGGSLVVYADYVCPFCYLGRQSLERYLASRDEPLAVEWHPFDLRSRKRRSDGSLDHSVDDGKDEDYYAEARQNVRKLRERYDVEMAQEIATDVDSLPAQVASDYVQREHPDCWRAFDAAVFDALWQSGRDIGDREVLLEVADDVGLDPTEVGTVLDDEDARERVRERFAAAQRAGVSGVPTFVYQQYAARGAVPPEQLARLVEGDGR